MKEMIREAISKRLKEKGISQRKCAIDNGIIYQAFNAFLNKRRTLPLDDIEKLLNYLDLQLLTK